MCIAVMNAYIKVGSVVYCFCGIDCVWVLGRGFQDVTSVMCNVALGSVHVCSVYAF